MSLYEILGTVEIGLVFGLVALGAYLSFRILDFPDLTVEGSFPLGRRSAGDADRRRRLESLGGDIGGDRRPDSAAGFATAYLNVRFNILHILAGILLAISLYSINLRIMSGPNKPLLGSPTIFSMFDGWSTPSYMLAPILILVLVVAVKFALDLFLSTGIGLSMRAAGANPAMAAANGVDVGRMKLLGIGFANALTAFAGALFAQIFGAADAYMGIGVIIIGLASVIVGMSILPSRTVMQATFACVIGALLYRFAVALALDADFLGFRASDVQLLTAALVALTLIGKSSRSGMERLVRRIGSR